MSARLKMRLLLLAIAAFAVAYGLWRGEAALIYRKAARICLECIGLG